MKKKLILAGAAMLLTVAAVTGFSAYNKTDASDLLNANIEALTSGETSKLGDLMYRDKSDNTTEYCCDRSNPVKQCSAADCNF